MHMQPIDYHSPDAAQQFCDSLHNDTAVAYYFYRGWRL